MYYGIEKTVERHLKSRKKKIRQMQGIPLITAEQLDHQYERDPTVRMIANFYKTIDFAIQDQPQTVLENGRWLRAVWPTPIDDLVRAMCLFHTVYRQGFPEHPIFIDMGSNDGRAVALAAVLGYKSYGIELDDMGHQNGEEYFRTLRIHINALENAVLIHGDYRDTATLAQAHAHEADVFYNYDDGHPDDIGHLILSHGKSDALFLVQSYKYIADRVPLPLAAVLKHHDDRDYPAYYDVFGMNPKNFDSKKK